MRAVTKIKEKIFTAKEIERGISGPRMAAYLREIAETIDTSDKLFTAKITITVMGRVVRGK